MIKAKDTTTYGGRTEPRTILLCSVCGVWYPEDNYIKHLTDGACDKHRKTKAMRERVEKKLIGMFR